MNDKEIFKKVGVILSELNDQYHYLSKNPGSLNEFELELLRANVHFLNDHIEILQRVTGSSRTQPVAGTPGPGQDAANEVPVKNEVPLPDPVLPAEEKEEAGNGEAKAVEPAAQDEETAPEPESEEVDRVMENVMIKEQSLTHNAPVAHRQPVADEPVVTVREQIAATMGSPATLAGSLGNQPVTDLKAAISLNDKLLFIKDLFNGYSLAYSEAIDRANRAADLETAKQFLQANYAVKNNWESKPATVEKLYGLLQRKFGD